jgi:hypothetical protein
VKIELVVRRRMVSRAEVNQVTLSSMTRAEDNDQGDEDRPRHRFCGV